MILDGKKLRDKILEDLTEKFAKSDRKPTLAVILAGDDPASRIYVSNKEKKSMELGFKSSIYRFDSNVSQNKIIDLIIELNENPSINGILIQLPLFSHLDEREIIGKISPKKDVDGFHPINIGKLYTGLNPYAICCTPLGIMKLLDEYKINLEGKSALVIGRSNIVGRPMAELLLRRNATVTIAHSKTKDLKIISKNSDIIVSATGCPKTVKADMVKKGAVIIDVGITRLGGGKITGDVDFKEVHELASYITPVPGGVGPMTIACLMENTYKLFLEQNNYAD